MESGGCGRREKRNQENNNNNNNIGSGHHQTEMKEKYEKSTPKEQGNK